MTKLIVVEHYSGDGDWREYETTQEKLNTQYDNPEFVQDLIDNPGYFGGSGYGPCHEGTEREYFIMVKEVIE